MSAETGATSVIPFNLEPCCDDCYLFYMLLRAEIDRWRTNRLVIKRTKNL